MKFLIPTDFSENAFHAAIYALTLAKEKTPSSIHVLHVITPVLNDPALIRGIEKEATISLEKIGRELNARCNTCRTSHSIRLGGTSTEINNAAEELNIGIIVMGIRGLGKTKRLLFGSNTVSLINKSSRPVLVVPETSAFAAPKKIAYATDYYDSDLDALERILPIAKAFNSEIVVVHIFNEASEEHLEQGMMDFISRQISNKFEYPRMSYKVYNSKDVAMGIKTFCEFSEADLLVLSARRRNVFQRLFHNSVTKDITYNSNIPLLIFHIDGHQ